MSENNLKQLNPTPCSLFSYMGHVMFNLNGDKKGRDEFIIYDNHDTGLMDSTWFTFMSHSEEVITDRASGEHLLNDKLSTHEKAMIILETAITVETYDPEQPYEIGTNIVELIQKAYDDGALEDLIDASQYDNSIEAVMAKIEEGINDQMDSETFRKLAITLYNYA